MADTRSMIPRGELDCDDLLQIRPSKSELVLEVAAPREKLMTKLIERSALGSQTLGSNPGLIKLKESRTATECKYAFKHPRQDLIGAGNVWTDTLSRLVSHVHTLHAGKIVGCTWVEDRTEAMPTGCMWRQEVRLRASGGGLLSRSVTKVSGRIDRAERFKAMKEIALESVRAKG